MKIDFEPHLRISSISEEKEDTGVFITVVGEIIPRYKLGLPDINYDLEPILNSIYEKYSTTLPNTVAVIIRDLAIETMVTNDKPKRAYKLESIKFKLIESSKEYDPDHLFLSYIYKYKPSLIPVFEPNFFYQGVIYSKPLIEDKG